MKKLIVLVVVVLLLGAGGGGVWWTYFHHTDRLAQARELMAKGDLKAAQIELRNVVRDDPSNADAHFRLGLLHMRTGDPVAAERELVQARNNGFDPRAVLPLLAQSYMAQGKFTELLKDFPEASLPHDAAAQIILLRGLAQMQLKEDDAAARSFDEAEKLAPQSPDPLLASARLLIGQRNYPAAETKVARALAINAKAPEALLLRGQLLNLEGKRDEALKELDAALAAAPNMIAARLERANIRLTNNDDAGARDDVEAVLKLQPRSAGAIYLQAVLQARAKDYTAADQGFTRIQSLLSRFPRGYYFQAVVKYNLGQAEQAATAASKYVTANPLDLDGVKLLARIDLAMQRPGDAEQTLNRAVAAGQADADTLDLLGRAYSQSGKRAQALQAFERAAELAPTDPGILTRLASARLGTGDASGATRDLEHSLKLAPDGKAAGEALVVASLAAGEVDKAAAALGRLQKDKTDPALLGILTGLVRMAELDFSGARTAFEAVLKDQPNSIPARLNLAKIAVLQNHMPEAEQALNEVLRQNPANEQALSGLLAILIPDGRLNTATTVVEAARAAAPANNNLTVALSDLYLRQREPKKALALLDQAQKGQLPSPPLLAALVRAQSAAGEPEAAADSLRRMLAIEPRNVQVRRGLADLLVQLKKVPEARQVLREGLTIQPSNPALLQGLVGIAYHVDGLDAGIKAIDELAKNPTDASGLIGMRGDLLMAAKRYDDAAKSYGEELKQHPETSLVVRQSSALSAGHHPEQALKVLTDWVAAHPDDVPVQLTLATGEIGARQNAEAIKRLELVLAKQPSNVIALNNLAWLYQEVGDKRAREIAQKAYLLAPTPQIADTLGWVLTADGDAKTALPLLRSAAKALPDSMAVQYHLGVALKQLGQKDEAISVLRPIVLGPQQFDDKAEAKRVLDSLTSGG